MKEYKPFTCLRGQLNIRGQVWGDLTDRRQVIIMCHGFLGNRDMCRRYAETLVKKGHIAVTFDFSGGGPHSASDGNSEDMTVFTEIEDLLAVIN